MAIPSQKNLNKKSSDIETPCFIVTQSCIVLLMHLAHRIHKQGFRAGIWIMEFLMNEAMAKRNPKGDRLVPKGNKCYTRVYKDSKETNRPSSLM